MVGGTANLKSPAFQSIHSYLVVQLRLTKVAVLHIPFTLFNENNYGFSAHLQDLSLSLFI